MDEIWYSYAGLGVILLFGTVVYLLILQKKLKKQLQDLPEFQNKALFLQEMVEELQNKISLVEQENARLLEERASYKAKLEANEQSQKQLKEEYERQSKHLELKLNEIMEKNLN
jgi:peptidoglycan hydrolase CwlO-like protein